MTEMDKLLTAFSRAKTDEDKLKIQREMAWLRVNDPVAVHNYVKSLDPEDEPLESDTE